MHFPVTERMLARRPLPGGLLHSSTSAASFCLCLRPESWLCVWVPSAYGTVPLEFPSKVVMAINWHTLTHACMHTHVHAHMHTHAGIHTSCTHTWARTHIHMSACTLGIRVAFHPFPSPVKLKSPPHTHSLTHIEVSSRRWLFMLQRIHKARLICSCLTLNLTLSPSLRAWGCLHFIVHPELALHLMLANRASSQHSDLRGNASRCLPTPAAPAPTQAARDCRHTARDPTTHFSR